VDAARGPSTPSFDHLVGGDEQLIRHGKAEHPRGLMVDDQLKFGRLQDGQICWLRAPKDTPGVGAGLTPRVRNVGSVAHQPADFGRLAVRKRSWDCVARRQIDQLDSPAGEKGVAGDEKRIGSVTSNRRESRIYLLAGAGVQDLDLHPYRARS